MSTESNPEAISALIGEIYDAATDPSRWPTVIHHLADALSGSSAAMISYADPKLDGVVHASHNLDTEALVLYEQHYHEHDILLQNAARKGFGVSGTVMVSDQYIDRDEYHRSMFYNEYASKLETDSVLTMVLWGKEPPAGTSPTFLAAYKPPAAPQFDANAVRLARVLTPHLQRALLIHRRLVSAEARARGGESVLDQLAHGVLQLSAEGRVLHANRAASAALDARGVLRLERGNLTTPVPGYAARLRALFAQAGHGIGGFLNIPTPDGKPGMLILATPLPEDSAMKWHVAARVLVLLSSAHERGSTRVALLARANGLTRAETRVVELLAADRSPAEIAKSLGTRVHTVRSQLKSIYLKTGVHGQRELLALLARLPDITIEQAPDRRLG